MFKTLLLFLLIACFPASISAQKIEVEKKIPRAEFPAEALKFLEEKFPGKKNSRFFLESGADTINYEAKSKWRGDCFSVEFLQDGKWKDTEMEVAFKGLTPSLQESVAAVLSESFSKFKVKRVQEQSMPGRLELRYEMEIKGKGPEGWGMWEYLFTSDGQLVEKQRILLPSNNITLY